MTVYLSCIQLFAAASLTDNLVNRHEDTRHAPPTGHRGKHHRISGRHAHAAALAAGAAGRGGSVGQAGIHESGGQRERPRGHRHDRARRTRRTVEAGRHHCGSYRGQHRHRAGADRGEQGIPGALLRAAAHVERKSAGDGSAGRGGGAHARRRRHARSDQARTRLRPQPGQRLHAVAI